MARTLKEPRVILYPHNRVHENKMWHYHVHTILANAASQGLVIAVGDNDLHLNFDVISSGSARVRFYENATVTACGEGTSPMNMNRYRAASGADAICSATIGTSPNVAAACWNQLLTEFHIPGGGKQSPAGGVVRGSTEWVLNKNTTYVLGASNLQGATGPTTLTVEFYED